MAEDAVSRRPALKVESEALARRSIASNRSNWAIVAVILSSDDAIAAVILCSDDAIAAVILCSDDVIAAVILCSDDAITAVILCHKCAGSSENGEWTTQYYIESDLCRSDGTYRDSVRLTL